MVPQISALIIILLAPVDGFGLTVLLFLQTSGRNNKLNKHVIYVFLSSLLLISIWAEA